MAWTYSGNPANNSKDAVRFLIGDTLKEDPILQDEEIAYLLTVNGDPASAAIQGCEQIAAKFSRLCDQTVGSVSLSYSQKAKAYLAMAAKLRERLAIGNAIPYAGGISDSDKQIAASDQDLVQPVFRKHMEEAERDKTEFQKAQDES